MNNIGTLKSRNKKLMFYGLLVDDSVVYTRMTGFTKMTPGKNPKEYTRQYVDEDFERSDIVGYAVQISYAFDHHSGNPVQTDIVSITDEEKIGNDAVRVLISVDIDTGVAYRRDFAVIPDSEGDDVTIYTYSGNFKAHGEKEKGTASSDDNWQTITFTPET